MKIKLTHPNATIPERKTNGAGGYDLYMPESGFYIQGKDQDLYTLGFAMEVPAGHVALILPRSGVGMNSQLELNNTCGVIDSDYRGEVMARIRTKNGKTFSWEKGERLLQMIIVPVATPKLVQVDELSDTDRGVGGMGSTGK